MQRLTVEQAWNYRIVPSSEKGIDFYIDAAININLIKEELEILSGEPVALQAVDTEVIQETLNRYYLKSNQEGTTAKKGLKAEVRSESFVSDLIQEAKSINSSDIHIETYEEEARVRFRIDGQLVERLLIGRDDYPSLVNKIKIMASLDISEKRLPQDGRIFYSHEQDKFDIRVSVLPTLHGEKIVLRILRSDASNIDIQKVGFKENDLFNYLEGVKKPHGIVLISGPTGSGKTTTLYATLKLLNTKTKNIVTIEDPIEYTLEGINQVQLKESIGLDFPKALRTFLRQDPDIIMVGEIRDQETANMAIRAALTGHLVLSTIHTNSAWGTVARLIDMGIPAYLIANTLNTTVAQRLIRLLCPHCKKEVPFERNIFPPAFTPYWEISSYYSPQGCSQCYFTGYKGRKALYEVIPVDTELAEHIKKNEFHIDADLEKRGIKKLAYNAFERFAQGDTSIDEIYPLLFS
ncbi:GspE/PulE family protein [Cytophagales bacterium LB-30]|uniref:GspE/PulE family protein n=1 Tax=Shiella aurantiaca TaxID=3058365 RepID=A0ABT8F522_9BACT|nr:GspE/PulE family protein [Shiella aurantiaca]MDN4165469.1 GspE/PulE family protein [Shiella aurantiaca]